MTAFSPFERKQLSSFAFDHLASVTESAETKRKFLSHPVFGLFKNGFFPRTQQIPYA